jgi:hypothetical protein
MERCAEAHAMEDFGKKNKTDPEFSNLMTWSKWTKDLFQGVMLCAERCYSNNKDFAVIVDKWRPEVRANARNWRRSSLRWNPRQDWRRRTKSKEK